MGCLGGSDSKESTCKAGDPGLVPGLGRSPGEGHGYLLQYSCLENSMHREADKPGGLQSMVLQRVRHNGAANTFTFPFHALGEEMATHSSVLAWRIPRMAEPSGLPSMGWHRVGHD